MEYSNCCSIALAVYHCPVAQWWTIVSLDFALLYHCTIALLHVFTVELCCSVVLLHHRTQSLLHCCTVALFNCCTFPLLHCCNVARLHCMLHCCNVALLHSCTSVYHHSTVALIHYTVLHYQCCITAQMQSSLNGVGNVAALSVVKIVVGFVFS